MAQHSTRELVARMHADGFKVRDIALAAGVSTQRVYQILHTLTDKQVR